MYQKRIVKEWVFEMIILMYDTTKGEKIIKCGENLDGMDHKKKKKSEYKKKLWYSSII